MELLKLDINGLSDVYAIDVVKKEFCKAASEKWSARPPWLRYQQKLMEDLAILDNLKHNAIGLMGFEKLTGENELYSIRHPKTPKNLRILFTFYGNSVILLTAFLEKGENDYQRAIDRARERLKWLKAN